MPTFFTTLLRCLGMLVLAALIAAIVPQVVLGLAHGPATVSRVEADIAPTMRETLGLTMPDCRIFLRSALVAGIAVMFALVIALPAVFAVAARPVLMRSRLARAVLAWPLLAPPSVVAYAWTLMATRRTGIPTWFGQLTGFNSIDAAPLWAGWMQAVWLWPLPALALVSAYVPRGQAAYRLALLDASPLRAFWRGVLPALYGPLAGALGLTFLLAINDVSIPPLAIGIGTTWPVMMQGEATRAATLESPTAYLVWRSWPMLALGAIVVVALLRGMRPLLAERDTASVEDLGAPAPCSAWAARACMIFTATISLLPMIVFTVDLAALGQRAMGVVQQSLLLYQAEWRASWIVALLCGACALAAGTAILNGGQCATGAAGKWHLRGRGVVLGLVVVLAVLPPVVIGQSLIATLDREWTVWPRLGLSLYDNVPVAPVLGVLARYAVVALLMVSIAERQMPMEQVEAARADGATTAQIIARVRMPALWRTALAAGVLVGSLGLSELAVSSMVEPVRFGGSLAVAVDRQIHFGRNEQVVATSLMLTLPALAALAAWPARGASLSFRDARD